MPGDCHREIKFVLVRRNTANFTLFFTWECSVLRMMLLSLPLQFRRGKNGIKFWLKEVALTQPIKTDIQAP